MTNRLTKNTRFVRSWVVALLVLQALVGATACAPSMPLSVAPARTSLVGGRVEIPMLPSFHGTPRVAVRANGTAAEMILDTGAFSTLVSPDLAARATADVRGGSRVRSMDAGGNVRVAQGIARFDALGLGAATFYDLDAVVQDVSVLGGAGEPAGGAIGMPVFRDVLLTIDYPREKVVIEAGELPEPNGRDVLPLRVGQTGRPMVPLRVGTREVWALLDTGFSSGLGLPNWARKQVPGASKSVPGPPFAYYHGRGQADRARLTDDLTIGWHVIRRPIVDLGLGSTPVIGGDYLRHFAVTIDQRNGRVRFTRKSIDPIHVPAIVGPGFYIDLQTATVIAVVPDSGAARAGLRVGDRLTTVEGVPFETYRSLRSPRVLAPGYVSLVYDRDGNRQAAMVRISVLLR